MNVFVGSRSSYAPFDLFTFNLCVSLCDIVACIYKLQTKSNFHVHEVVKRCETTRVSLKTTQKIGSAYRQHEKLTSAHYSIAFIQYL